MKRKLQSIIEKLKNLTPKTKGILTVALVGVIIGSSVCVYALTGDSNADKLTTKTVTVDDEENANEAVDKAQDEEKEAEAELEKAKASGDETAIKEAEEKVANAQKKVSTSKQATTTTNKTSTPAKSSSSTTKATTSTTSSSKANTSTNNNKSSGNTQPPTHTHSWQPVYATRTVQKITGYHSVWVCNCGSFRTTNNSELWKHHDTCNKSYYVDEVADYTNVQEQYVSGYKCSCGATK